MNKEDIITKSGLLGSSCSFTPCIHYQVLEKAKHAQKPRGTKQPEATKINEIRPE